MTDMTAEQALHHLYQLCWNLPANDERAANELIDFLRQALTSPRVPEGWRETIEKVRELIAGAPIDSLGVGHDEHCDPWPIRDEVVDSLTKLLTAAPAPAEPEPAGEPCRTINIDDIVAWADGVQGALGTEHANRVTEKEAAASRAVLAVIAACPHGVRRPHECKECADAVPASEALEWAEREFAAARQSPGEPVQVETTTEEALTAEQPERLLAKHQLCGCVICDCEDSVDTETAVAWYAYESVATILEPHMARPENPDARLPASITDSVQMLLDHWLATKRPQEGEE